MALKIAEEGIGSSLARYFEGAANTGTTHKPPIEGLAKIKVWPNRFALPIRGYKARNMGSDR